MCVCVSVKSSEIKMSDQAVIILTTGFHNFKIKHCTYMMFRRVYPCPSSGIKETTPTAYDTNNKVCH